MIIHHCPLAHIREVIAITSLMIQISVSQSMAKLMADQGIVRHSTPFHQIQCPISLQPDRLVFSVDDSSPDLPAAEADLIMIQRGDIPEFRGKHRILVFRILYCCFDGHDKDNTELLEEMEDFLLLQWIG